jgi:stage II sporulation protein E
MEFAQLRAAISSIVGFAASLYQLFVTGATTATLLFAVTMMLSTTVGTLLFSGLLDAQVTLGELLGREDPAERMPERGSGEILHMQLGGLALGFFLVLSLKGTAFFGLMLPYLLASAGTLCVSKRLGPLHGAVTGLIVTLGAGAIYAPTFALLGLASGLLFELGTFYALALGVAAGSVWGSYVGGLAGFLTVTPEMLIVSLLLWPLLVRLGSSSLVHERQNESAAAFLAVQRTAEQHRRVTADRMSEMSETFASLADAFRRVTDSSVPDPEELRIACDRACARHCADCVEHGDCSGEEAMRVVSESISRDEKTPELALPESFRAACANAEEIFKDCKEECAALLRAHGTASVTDALSRDYELFSRLLSEAVVAFKEENREDVELGAALCDAMRERGIPGAAVAVYGARQRWIVAGGSNWQGAAAISEELRSAFSELCGCRLSPPSFEITEGVVTLEMKSTRRFQAEACRAYRTADSASVSGDTVTFFENNRDYFYALLSDGMGHGSAAALTSGVCAVFLEQMLGAGNAKTTSLKLLNNLIRMGGEESGATVDLLELDLLSGQAGFIKSGAAPSYVKRGENLFRIRSKTVPIGLTESLDAEKIRFDVEPGDVIVMLSDGICQGGEDAPWLMEILSGEFGEDLSPIAERIVGVAAGTHDRRDDMSVALVRISEIPLAGESEIVLSEDDASLSVSSVTRELQTEPIL